MTSKNVTGENITGDETAPSGKSAEADGRTARLAQALRANLLKRKAKVRAAQSPRTPPEGGRQT
jgi:hypothetical protein